MFWSRGEMTRGTTLFRRKNRPQSFAGLPEHRSGCPARMNALTRRKRRCVLNPFPHRSSWSETTDLHAAALHPTGGSLETWMDPVSPSSPFFYESKFSIDVFSPLVKCCLAGNFHESAGYSSFRIARNRTDSARFQFQSQFIREHRDKFGIEEAIQNYANLI